MKQPKRNTVDANMEMMAMLFIVSTGAWDDDIYAYVIPDAAKHDTTIKLMTVERYILRDLSKHRTERSVWNESSQHHKANVKLFDCSRLLQYCSITDEI